MTIPLNDGLYREILTTTDSENFDPKLHTFSLEDPYYTTYINIGIWKSVGDFERLVASKYIPEITEKDGKQIIEINDFEFKIRERIILKVIADRGTSLPAASYRI